MPYKVLVLNGSPKARGCTATALQEVIDTLHEEGIETELIHVGKEAVRGCMGCGYCSDRNIFIYSRAGDSSFS